MRKKNNLLAGIILLAIIICILSLKEKDMEKEEKEIHAEQSGVSLSVFKADVIDETVRNRIAGKSFPADALITEDQLRYLTVSYYGFDGVVHQGELLVNEVIAADVLNIFRELLEVKYPIESIRLIDDYDAADEKSMEANNTSSFNYRVIAGTDKLSSHAQGLAVDINPLYNPYVKEGADGLICEPAVAVLYADRSKEFPYKIEEGDICCSIFKKYGFTWGGDWKNVKDYQHFEKETGK